MPTETRAEKSQPHHSVLQTSTRTHNFQNGKSHGNSDRNVLLLLYILVCTFMHDLFRNKFKPYIHLLKWPTYADDKLMIYLSSLKIFTILLPLHLEKHIIHRQYIYCTIYCTFSSRLLTTTISIFGQTFAATLTTYVSLLHL